MKAEKPFIMHETITWIKERTAKKKNDPIFMNKFYEKRITIEDLQKEERYKRWV